MKPGEPGPIPPPALNKQTVLSTDCSPTSLKFSPICYPQGMGEAAKPEGGFLEGSGRGGETVAEVASA